MKIGKLYLCTDHPFGFTVKKRYDNLHVDHVDKLLSPKQCNDAIYLLVAIEHVTTSNRVMYKGSRTLSGEVSGSFWKLTVLHGENLWEIGEVYSLDAIRAYWKRIES